MTWNYRVLRHAEDPPPAEGEESFRIIEAFYDDGGDLYAWSTAEPFGETVEELRRDLELMLSALDQPVLNYDELPGT